MPRIDKILKNEYTESVTVVIKAFGFDFDMLAEHIESECFKALDIILKGALVLWRVDAVGKVALIENPVTEDRFAVE